MAGLRRVRGVESVEVDGIVNEVIVTRREGQAPDATLLATLQRVGYPGTIIPVRHCTLRITGVEDARGAAQVRGALQRVRGVRQVNVQVPRAFVSFDSRRARKADFIQAVERAGFTASCEGGA